MPAAITQFTAKKRKAFLAALAECGNVSRAAEAAHCTREGAYKLRGTDPDFAAAWDDALEQASDKLEQEAWRRASEGVLEPAICGKGLVYDKDGVPVMVRKYSDTLLIFLLKGCRPQKYRDNVNVTAAVQQLGITVVLEQMRDDRTICERAAEFVGLIDAATKAEQ